MLVCCSFVRTSLLNKFKGEIITEIEYEIINWNWNYNRNQQTVQPMHELVINMHVILGLL